MEFESGPGAGDTLFYQENWAKSTSFLIPGPSILLPADPPTLPLPLLLPPTPPSTPALPPALAVTPLSAGAAGVLDEASDGTSTRTSADESTWLSTVTLVGKSTGKLGSLLQIWSPGKIFATSPDLSGNVFSRGTLLSGAVTGGSWEGF